MALSTVLSLASGGGGLDRGVDLALGGTRTICYVENEVTAAAYLVEAIRAGQLSDAPVWTDLKSFDAQAWRGKVDGVIGGYPCQPFSVAGKRLGAADPRHLWPYIADIVRAVEPRWCFFENVGGHLRLGFREVAEELRGMGYHVAATLYRAEEVGAPHRRERLFIMAHRNSSGFGSERGSGLQLTGASLGHDANGRGEELADSDERDDDWRGDAGARWGAESANGLAAVGDTDLAGLEGRRGPERGRAYLKPAWPPGPQSDAWADIPERLWPATPQPSVRSMADGLARADLLRIYGNGVVPQQAAAAFRELWEALSQ